MAKCTENCSGFDCLLPEGHDGPHLAECGCCAWLPDGDELMAPATAVRLWSKRLAEAEAARGPTEFCAVTLEEQ